jgi:hypothetical protein
MPRTVHVYVPPTADQGTFYAVVHATAHGGTVPQRALWFYNAARFHDGQPPLKRMPRGTEYRRGPRK